MSCVQILQISIHNESTVKDSKWNKLISLFKSAGENLNTLWAVQEENKAVASIAAIWKSLEDQKAFAAAKESELSHILEALTSKRFSNDIVIFPEDAGPALSAPIDEQVSWIHPVSKIDRERENKVAYGFTQFAAAINGKAPEAAGGLVGGWGQVEFEYEGVKFRRFTAFIGWKSVEEHYKCKETALFMDNVHWLRENGHSGMEMVHYKYADSV